jgi:glycosyltransferase involved in cell wall biosynthesis
MKPSILHIITDLSTGGAEMMLYKLLSYGSKEKHKATVISLTDIGSVGRKIEALGIPVKALGMRRGVPNPLALLRLAYWIRQSAPHLIQTWMYHADLVGGLAAKLAGHIPLIWNIRHSDLNPLSNKQSTLWTAKICAKLSKILPMRIICCSESSRETHIKLGYDAQKMMMIPNGFDLTTFNPDLSARQSVRQELGISEDTLLIGLFGRFNPQKDHTNFIRAAALLNRGITETHFLLCGDQINWENSTLVDSIKNFGLSRNFHLLGERRDIPRLTAALDIACSSSAFGEGFPNVIGEAMACAVPCVVTNVGDSALIVGNTGRVVPPKEPNALASAWSDWIEKGSEYRKQLGLAARCRIEEHYNLLEIVKKYQNFYEEIIAHVRS